jgi:hypothetical protein
MRRVLILLVAVLFVVAIAGCGGGDEAASDTDTTEVTETTTDETPTDETTTDETTTDTDNDLGAFASGECAELVQASQALGAALAAAGSSGSDLTESSEAFQEFVDKAPEEIRADVQILADAYAKYADALQDIDLQSGETPSAEDVEQLTQAMEAVDQAEVTAAAQRLSTWATENCSTD